MELAYYPGCSLKASSEIYDVQCKRVLSAIGINLHELDDWNCCGATSASKVDDFIAIAMPARNLGIADASEYTELVIPCSACYSRMLVTQKILEVDRSLLDEINGELSNKVIGRTRILSILEAIQPVVNSGDLAKRVTRKLEGLKPACYYGCMQTRFSYGVPVLDDVENPQGMETILEALGATPLDWSYKTDCCGASAAVNENETSIMLMSKIMKDAIARQANCFVTTCPMCQLNLDAYQEKIRAKYDIAQNMPVYFITELIGVAVGLPPEDLGVERHFVDAMALLRELNLYE
ncbi:MAG: CoB--CoM heterodisulfide reductase iron-sulfur subunit B family protein [Syntrophobacteraceae bacterium]